MPSFYQLRADLTEIVFYARELGNGAELVAQAVWLVMLAGDPYPHAAKDTVLETMRGVSQEAVTAALASLKEFEEKCALQ